MTATSAPSRAAKSTVVITGGSGFLGSYVASAVLRAGHEPISLDLAPPRHEVQAVIGEPIPWARLDVTSAAEVDSLFRSFRPSVVVHTAAVAEVAALRTDPVRAYRVNTEGTVSVLEACRRYDITRVVLVSSIGVLSRRFLEPIPVNHPTLLADEGPSAGAYGASKLAAEAFALAYAASTGLDVRIVRPSAVYGFGMNVPIDLKPMVEAAAARRSFRLPTAGRIGRDYTHVSDVAELIVRLALGQPTDSVFYGATGGPLTTAAEAADVLNDLVGANLIEVGEQWSDAERSEVPYRGVLDITNARNQLGWRPQFDLASGLEQYLRRQEQFNAGR